LHILNQIRNLDLIVLFEEKIQEEPNPIADPNDDDDVNLKRIKRRVLQNVYTYIYMYICMYIVYIYIYIYIYIYRYIY
jgi:hypothetical protein